jgi:hypothetical protein
MSRTTLKVPTANTKTTMIMTISCRVSPTASVGRLATVKF